MFIELHITLILEINTIIPTPINIFLTGNLPTSLATRGAANSPPAIIPMIVPKWLVSKMIKKVKALAIVTKNSVKLTDPITYLGLLPLDISVLVTNGPIRHLQKNPENHRPLLTNQPWLLF